MDELTPLPTGSYFSRGGIAFELTDYDAETGVYSLLRHFDVDKNRSVTQELTLTHAQITEQFGDLVALADLQSGKLSL